MAFNTLAPFDLTTPNLVEGLILWSDRIVTVPVAGGRTARSAVVTPGVATQEITTYRLTDSLTKQTISFVSDASPTAAEVVTGLIAAFRANPILNGMATVSGTTTMTITNRISGTDAPLFSFADGGSTPTNVITVATTAATDATSIPFGRCLVHTNTVARQSLIAAAFSSTNVFAGVSGFTQADLETLPGRMVAGHTDGMALNSLRMGTIAVWSDSAVDPTANVFAIHDSNSANYGRFSAASGAGKSQITTGGVGWASRTTGAGLALLRVNIP